MSPVATPGAWHEKGGIERCSAIGFAKSFVVIFPLVSVIASKKQKPCPYCVICNNYKRTAAMCYRNEHKSDEDDDEDAEDDNGYATAKDDGNDDDYDGEDNGGNSSGKDDKSE